MRIRSFSSYSELSPKYILSEKEGKSGLYSYEGKHIIPHEFEAIDIHDDDHYLQSPSVRTALAFYKGRFTFFNLETGDRSEDYHELRLAGGKAIAQHKKGKWWVIDSDGSEMGSGPKDWYASEESLSLHDSIVMVSTKQGRKAPYQKMLYHYGRSVFSTEECQWMFRVEIDGDYYCWSKSGKSFIIFDSQLRKVKTLKGRFTDVLEDLEHSTYSKTLPIQILRNDEGFIGGFDARGKEVIPQKYDGVKLVTREERHKHGPRIVLPDYFEFYNDTSLAYYSLKGELIRALNFKSIYPLSGNFYAAKTENYTSVLDMDYQLVLDSCDRAFQFHALNKDWSTQFSRISTDNKYVVYALRNKKAYVEDNGRFELMDSTRYDFKHHLQFKFDVLIDPSGSIVSPEGATLRRVGSYYIAEKDELLTVLFLDGGIDSNLVDLDKFEGLGGHLYRCSFRNGKQGIYNTGHSKWVMPPEEQYIVPVSGIQGRAKYCIRRPKTNSHWQFYSAGGKIVSELELDHSISNMSSMNLVRIDGKMGVLSSNLELLMPAEYDYISSFKNAIFLKKSGQWFVTTSFLNHLSQGYYSISTRYYPNGRLVFKDGLIGVVDQTFQEIVPPSTEGELLEKYDLATLLIPTNQNQIDRFPIVSDDNTDASKKINNRIILEASRFHTTKNDIMPLSIHYSGELKQLQKLNDTERRKQERPHFFSKSYYACSIYKSTNKWGGGHYDKKETIYYHNYEWKGGKLEKINLTDLFNSPLYEPHLDSLIIDHINAQQSYGISCVNLEEVLALAKENFLLNPEGIVLFSMNRTSDRIVIPYQKVLQFLKRPEEFSD